MSQPQDALRIAQLRTRVRYYSESLTALLAATDDKRLIALVDETLESVDAIETDPLLYTRHDRRRPERLARWLNSIEERLSDIEADYRILLHWIEHPVSRTARTAESGSVTLEPALVKLLDGVCNVDVLFFSGIALTASPVVAGLFLGPYTILYLMAFGLLCSVGSLLLAPS